MTFAEAFQSARAQVGPGGVFEWHGGVYGTYTADEWNAMSAEDKAAFTRTAMSNVHPPQLSAHRPHGRPSDRRGGSPRGSL